MCSLSSPVSNSLNCPDFRYSLFQHALDCEFQGHGRHRAGSAGAREFYFDNTIVEIYKLDISAIYLKFGAYLF